MNQKTDMKDGLCSLSLTKQEIETYAIQHQYYQKQNLKMQYLISYMSVKVF